MYKIIGANGQQYGPVDGEQLRKWITQGRVERTTPVFVEGANDWNFVGLLPEFTGCFTPPPPPIAPPPPATGAAGQLPRTNSYALAGMIFGILSIIPFCCCCGFPFSLLGLIFSLIGWSQINQSPHLFTGRGLAITGLVCSITSLVLGAVWMLVNILTNQAHISWNTGQF